VSWLRIRELVRKEFIQLFRDPKNRRVLTIAPILQLMIFGYVVNYDITAINVAFLDRSRTPESRKLITSFTGNGIFHLVTTVTDHKTLETLLLKGGVELGITVPPDFAEIIQKGHTASIQVLVDGSMSNMASIRIGYAMQVLERFNRDRMYELYPIRLTCGQIDPRLRTWYNPNLESRYFFVPGIVAFTVVLISLLLTSIAIIKEKEAGTMEQLIVTPLRPIELIAGKTIPYVLISLVQMLIVTLLALYWFEIPMKGNVFFLFFATCLFLISSMGLGLFISTVSSTQQQAMMTTFFFILPMFMLSGFVFPIANMPLAVRWIAYLNPLTYFLIIIRGIFLKGVGFTVLWPQTTALVAIGFVLFTGSIRRFRKRLD